MSCQCTIPLVNTHKDIQGDSRLVNFTAGVTRKSPLVNRASQVALRDVEPVGTRTFRVRCDSQLALFKTERRG